MVARDGQRWEVGGTEEALWRARRRDWGRRHRRRIWNQWRTCVAANCGTGEDDRLCVPRYVPLTRKRFEQQRLETKPGLPAQRKVVFVDVFCSRGDCHTRTKVNRVTIDIDLRCAVISDSDLVRLPPFVAPPPAEPEGDYEQEAGAEYNASPSHALIMTLYRRVAHGVNAPSTKCRLVCCTERSCLLRRLCEKLRRYWLILRYTRPVKK